MEDDTIVRVPQRRRQTLDLSSLKLPASNKDQESRLRASSDAAGHRHSGAKPGFTHVSSPYSEYSRTVKLKARRGALRRKSSRSHLDDDGSVTSEPVGNSLECSVVEGDDIFNRQTSIDMDDTDDIHDNADEDLPTLATSLVAPSAHAGKPPLPSSASSHMLRVLDERSLRRSLNGSRANLADVKFPRSFTQDYLDLSCLEESFDQVAEETCPLAQQLDIAQRGCSPKVRDWRLAGRLAGRLGCCPSTQTKLSRRSPLSTSSRSGTTSLTPTPWSKA